MVPYTKTVIDEYGEKNVRFFDRKYGESRYQCELAALLLLEENFINIPKISHYPFPKIISYTDKSITMSYCGINAVQNAYLSKKPVNNKWPWIEKYSPWPENITYTQPNNIYNTVICIINNLLNLDLIYKDFKIDNVCINKNGYISLIDFEVSIREARKPRYIDYYKKPNLVEFEDNLYTAVGCNRTDCLILSALKKRVWKEPLFKNIWSMLYAFQ